MDLAVFKNDTGEGVVSFQHSGQLATLLIGGMRAFEFGNACGTCGIVFSRVGPYAYRVSDTTAVQLLGNLDAIPSPDVLRSLARVLQPGVYYPSIVEETVKLVEPGSSDDYFVTDVARLFGHDESDDIRRTPYYRFGVDRSLDRTGRLHGPHKALVTAIVMPLHEPGYLNRKRIEYWKQRFHAGMTPTAFAVAVLDDQAPAMYPADDTYPYEEQFLLTLCTLDGHHRMQAAAELELPVRILSLLAKDFSIYSSDDIATVLSGYAP